MLFWKVVSFRVFVCLNSPLWEGKLGKVSLWNLLLSVDSRKNEIWRHFYIPLVSSQRVTVLYETNIDPQFFLLLANWTTLFLILSGEIPTSQPTLFEYFFDSKKLVWVPWVDVIPEYVHDPEKKFSEILVPTVDTVRTTWLLELMVSVKRPVVLVGETGTSKSATTANFLRGLDKDSTVCC